METKRRFLRVYGLLLASLAVGLSACGGGGGSSNNNQTSEITNTFGGEGIEYVYSLQQTADDGFVLAGSTVSFGATWEDAYLIRTDAQGNKLWEKTFGGSGKDVALSVQQTADSGFVLAGSTQSFGAGFEDAYLVRTDAQGNKLWEKTFGGSGQDFARSVQQTADGGFVLAGYTSSFGDGSGDAYLVRTDAQGTMLWEKTFGGSSMAHSVQETTDGGFILAGTSNDGVYDNGYLVRTDAQGIKLWEKTFVKGLWAHIYSVQQTSDGGFVLAGETFTTNGKYAYLVRTDAQGNLLWQRSFGVGKISLLTNAAYDVKQTTDGGFILAGDVDSGHVDAWLIRTNSQGNKLWQRTFGGTGIDRAHAVLQTDDGGFVLAGDTAAFGGGTSDAFLLFTDAQGNP